MKIFLTGGTGFVGSYLEKNLLKKNHEILHLSRRENEKRSHVRGSLELVAESPLSIEHALREFKPDAVIHLAWGYATNTHRDDPLHFSVNLTATKNLATIVSKLAHPCFFLGVGSQAEYGVLNQKLDETLECHPVNAYGKAKLEAGKYILDALPTHAAWVRILTAYGPRDDTNKLIPYIFNRYKTGLAPELSPGKQLWDWLYAEDLANALSAVVEKKSPGLYVVASEENATIEEVASKIHRLFVEKKSSNYPKPILGAKPYRDQELFNLTADASKFKKTFDWKPSFSLERGLENIYESVSATN